MTAADTAPGMTRWCQSPPASGYVTKIHSAGKASTPPSAMLLIQAPFLQLPPPFPPPRAAGDAASAAGAAWARGLQQEPQAQPAPKPTSRPTKRASRQTPTEADGSCTGQLRPGHAGQLNVTAGAAGHAGHPGQLGKLRIVTSACTAFFSTSCQFAG